MLLSTVNKVSTRGHIFEVGIKLQNPVTIEITGFSLASQKGFEPLTYGLEVRCSIQLSYWDI